jgi:hypothetical protein
MGDYINVFNFLSHIIWEVIGIKNDGFERIVAIVCFPYET